jgi:hypothetical protein
MTIQELHTEALALLAELHRLGQDPEKVEDVKDAYRAVLGELSGQIDFVRDGIA